MSVIERFADLVTATVPWLDQLLDGLAGPGWVVLPAALPADLCCDLLAQVQRHDGLLQPAAIGRAAGRQAAANVRRDKTHWLEPDSVPVARYLALMEQVRQALNQQLFLGLQEYEAHFARYDAGDFYRRHVDTLRGQRNRVVSCVSYLNPQWQPQWGGQLVLYDGAQRELSRVLPEAGTMIFFLSEDFPHEVLPANSTRYSIAGWYRVRAGAAIESSMAAR
jgi:SM-20-related protein